MLHFGATLKLRGESNDKITQSNGEHSERLVQEIERTNQKGENDHVQIYRQAFKSFHGSFHV